MRRIFWLLTIFGAAALATAVAVDTVHGQLSRIAWIVVGPLPCYAVGVLAWRRATAQPVVLWLLAVGSLFIAEVCLGASVTPLVADTPFGFGSGTSFVIVRPG